MPDPNTVVIAAFAFAGVALTAVLAWVNSRGTNAETRRMTDRERLAKLEGDVGELRAQIGSLHKQLDKWRGVIGAVREMFWEVYQAWPADHPMIRFRAEHMRILRDAEVEDIVPVRMHNEPEDMN